MLVRSILGGRWVLMVGSRLIAVTHPFTLHITGSKKRGDWSAAKAAPLFAVQVDVIVIAITVILLDRHELTTQLSKQLEIQTKKQ
jgi:hypothetical protein